MSAEWGGDPDQMVQSVIGGGVNAQFYHYEPGLTGASVTEVDAQSFIVIASGGSLFPCQSMALAEQFNQVPARLLDLSGLFLAPFHIDQ